MNKLSRRDFLLSGVAVTTVAATQLSVQAQNSNKNRSNSQVNQKDCVFICNEDSNTLSVIDPLTNQVETTINPLVRQLAVEIINSQQVEIAAMHARLAVLEQGAEPLPDGFPALDGTRGNLILNLRRY